MNADEFLRLADRSQELAYKRRGPYVEVPIEHARGDKICSWPDCTESFRTNQLLIEHIDREHWG